MCLYLTSVNVLLLGVMLLFTSSRASPASTAIGESMDSSIIPVLASGKRQHNIMRFGKRPSPVGHNLIHFGKRPVISSSSRSLPDILDYFLQQENRRDSTSHKRGHSIMRFGKRVGLQERFARDYYGDEDKKTGTGHSMMYFGKRDQIVPYSAFTGNEREYHLDKKSAEKKSHAMIHFGKRESEEDEQQMTDREHNLLRFGKKSGTKGSHAMIHFGKREFDESDDEEQITKREHNLLRFGKRSDTKGSHAMIHFGKRELDENDDEEQIAKREHNLLRFGKKSDTKESHTMDHFGKRESEESDDEEMMKQKERDLLLFGKKRDRIGSHAIIHFGKRIHEEGRRTPILPFGGVLDDKKVAVMEKPSESQRERASGPIWVHYENEEKVPMLRKTKKLIFYDVNDEISPDEFSIGKLVKKDSGKNSFLRFG